MGEARAVNRIDANLPQEKIDFINTAYTEEVDYWKRATSGSKNKVPTIILELNFRTFKDI